MSNIIINLNVGLNKETAKWINEQGKMFIIDCEGVMNRAFELGRILCKLTKEYSDEEFRDWLTDEVTSISNISKRTAYDYIDYYKYKSVAIDAINLTDALKQISVHKAKLKELEYEKSAQRMIEYQKTGVKPDGYKKNTDERRAKKAVQIADTAKCTKSELDISDSRSKAWLKIWDNRDETSESKLVLELIKKLDSLDNDNQRIETCHDIIKLCKKISAELQK